MRYWYHPESDSAFEDDSGKDQDRFMDCVEWTKDEYDAFQLGVKKSMSIEELSIRYKTLETQARAVSMTIGQHEQRIDTALADLKEAMPDQAVSDPRAIPFETLIKATQDEIVKITAELEDEFTTLEQKVADANTELRKLVESA